jgi:hypothetical protein
MDSTSTVNKTLDSFFNDKELKVLVLKGLWGIGKTYFWENYINKKIFNEDLPYIAYSYISLFGLRNLAELKSKILSSGQLLNSKNIQEEIKEIEEASKSENQIFRAMLGIKSSGQNWLRAFSQQTQWGKLLPQAQGYSSLINSLEYSLISNYLVCIDDIERKEKDLSIGQLMGLVDELSKRKNCKIILILNDQTLEDFDSKDFDKYREKIVDLEVEYKPTIRENLLKVFKGDEIYFERLLEIFQTVGGSNIRVFKKLKWTIYKVWEFIDSCEDALQLEVASHLAILCWGFFSPEKKLFLSYIGEGIRNDRWFILSLDPEKEKDLTDKEKEWYQIFNILSIYPLKYDDYLVSLLIDGYLDTEAFRREINESNQQEQVNLTKQKLRTIWNIYSDSFNDNLDQFKAELRNILESDLDRIPLWEFSEIIDLLEEYDEDVSSYVQKYVKLQINVLTNTVLEDFLFGRKINSNLKSRIQEFRDIKKPFSIDDVLSRIIERQGWSQAEINFLSSLTEDEIYEWMMSSPEHLVQKVRQGLFQFKEFKSGSDDRETRQYQAIYSNTEAALIRIAKQNPFNEKRVKYIYGIGVSDESNLE